MSLATVLLVSGFLVPHAQAAGTASLTFKQVAPFTVDIHGAGFGRSTPVQLLMKVGICSRSSLASTNTSGSFVTRVSTGSSCKGAAVVVTAVAGATKATGTYRFNTQTNAMATAKPSGPVSLKNVKVVAQVTGEASPNKTSSRFDVAGTDLGVMWDRGDGKVLVAFGDTFGDQWTPEHRQRPDAWRSNWIAVSTTKDLSKGLALDGVNAEDNSAPMLIKPAPGEITIIPTAAIAYDGKQYMHYMAVNFWGTPGVWKTASAGVAVSADGGATWDRGGDSTRIPNPGGTSPFQMAAFAYGPDKKLYALGTPQGRYGDIRLARIDGEPNNISSWVYWNGTAWSKKVEDAKVIAKGPAGEASLGWHQGLRRWLMLYRDEDQGAVVIRSAAKLTGPWTSTSIMAPDKNYNSRVYGPFIHPASLKSGKSLYFMMTNEAGYNTFLMKGDLVASGG